MSSASLHWLFFMSKYFSVETGQKQLWKGGSGGDANPPPAWTGFLGVSERLTQQVDDALVVRGKQPYGVFEEQHERRVDHPVGQLVRVGLRKRQSPDISIIACQARSRQRNKKQKKSKKALPKSSGRPHREQMSLWTGKASHSTHTCKRTFR